MANAKKSGRASISMQTQRKRAKKHTQFEKVKKLNERREKKDTQNQEIFAPVFLICLKHSFLSHLTFFYGHLNGDAILK